MLTDALYSCGLHSLICMHQLLAGPLLDRLLNDATLEGLHPVITLSFLPSLSWKLFRCSTKFYHLDIIYHSFTLYSCLSNIAAELQTLLVRRPCQRLSMNFRSMLDSGPATILILNHVLRQAELSCLVTWKLHSKPRLSSERQCATNYASYGSLYLYRLHGYRKCLRAAHKLWRTQQSSAAFF